MSQEKIGFFAAAWRLLTFYKLRQALGLVRKADQMFTGSVEGIRDGFALYKDDLIDNFNKMTQAVTQAVQAQQMQEDQLEKLVAQIKDTEMRQSGADILYDEAEEKGDQAGMARARKDSERFSVELERLQQEKKALEEQIAQDEINNAELKAQLSSMLSEIEALKGEEAKQIAQFITSNAKISAYETAKGLKSAIDSSPIDAIREANKERAAKAKVLGEVTRATSEGQDDKYRKAAANTNASDAFAKRKAAREVEKAQKEAAKNNLDTTTEKESRPKNF